ncbi:hypothetical protein DEO72_LG1g2356 [Vigna unguiculata]|uniref:Secreted protein n=1 Tax=Vigna unguiculata TaxID=3917 RepID=A0A4D6KPX2_VIGUN|nr:hypothetical protein DEO72_LG1g2356 [Vigna unguiculata]
MHQRLKEQFHFSLFSLRVFLSFLYHRLRAATVEGSALPPLNVATGEGLPPLNVADGFIVAIGEAATTNVICLLVPYSHPNSASVATAVTACARSTVVAACARSTTPAACAKPTAVSQTTTAACAKLQLPLLLVYYSSPSHLFELRCCSISPFLEVSFFNLVIFLIV